MNPASIALAAAAAAPATSSPKYYLRVLGDPILNQVATPVRAFSAIDPELLPAMRRIMAETEGVGIAACQVGSPLRISLAKKWDDAPAGGVWSDEINVLYNPSITRRSPEMVLHIAEGCLSCPNDHTGRRFFRTSTQRHAWVIAEWYSFENGRERHHEKKFTGPAAQLMQHEIDHLDGRCIFHALPRQQRRACERGVAAFIAARGFA